MILTLSIDIHRVIFLIEFPDSNADNVNLMPAGDEVFTHEVFHEPADRVLCGTSDNEPEPVITIFTESDTVRVEGLG